MFVRYEPSRSRLGEYCRIDGTYAPMTCMYSRTLSRTIQEVVGHESRVSSPKILHRVDGVWLDQPYQRRIYVQTFSPFIYWSDWKTRLEGGTPIPASNLSSMLRIDADTEMQNKFNNLVSQAETEARLKFAQSSVNVGEALAELRKTVGHLADTAARLSRWVMWASRGDWKSLRRDLGLRKPGHHGGSLSQNWLEYQYAWLPLMGDIYGTWQEAQRSLLEKAMIVSATRTVSDGGTQGFGYGSYTSPYNRVDFSYEVGVTVHLVARVASSGINRLAALGLINPAAVAWARMPWSFVIDWFIPVGNVLQSVTATQGLSFMTGSCTKRYTVDQDGLQGFLNTTGYAPKGGVVQVGSIGIKACHVQRVVYAGFPLPSLYSNPYPLSSKRIVSALALIRQNLRNVRL